MLDKLCFTDYGYCSTAENYDCIPTFTSDHKIWALSNFKTFQNVFSEFRVAIEIFPWHCRCCLVTLCYHGSFSQRLQDFTFVRTLDDASNTLISLCWNQQLLAAAGGDKKVRIYNSEKDAKGEAA